MMPKLSDLRIITVDSPTWLAWLSPTNLKKAFASTPVNNALIVTNRVLAAIFGGYLLSAVGCVLLAQILPLSQADSVLSAMMLSFSVYTCAVLWVFSVKQHWRCWFDLGALSAGCYLLYSAASYFNPSAVSGGI